jgi:hypothetical protein
MLTLLDERLQAIRAEWWARWAEASGTAPLAHLGARIEQGWSPQCDSAAAEPTEWGVLKTSAVSGNEFSATENKRLPDDVPVQRRWQVRDGDLLVVRGSGSVRSVGAVAVASPGDRLLTISDLLYRVRGLEGPPEFFAEALRAPQVRQLVESSIRTDVGQTLKLRSSDVTGLPIPAVALDRRSNAIDELQASLSTTSRLRELQGRQLDVILEHRKSVISAAVSDSVVTVA